jgi:hypothetical protein
MKALLRGNTGKRLVRWGALSAALFSVLALAQYFYLNDHLHETTIRELSEWANMVAADLKFTPRFDAQRYEQATPLAPRFFVVTNSGLILDIEGFVPGVFGRVSPPPSVTPGQPKTVVTSLGESYRILAKNVKGGTVYVGVPSPGRYMGVDGMLTNSILKFGDSIDSALRTRNSSLGELVEYAIVDTGSRLRGAIGGVPLSVDEKSVAALVRSHSFTSDHGHPYYLYSQPVHDSTGATAAFVLIPQDERLERALLRGVLHFNIKAAIAAWGIALGLFGAHLISIRKEWRDERLPLVDAIRQGEGPHREFKETLEVDVFTGGRRSETVVGTLKTIVAFLNGEGGTLYIGVADCGEIKGIQPDLSLLNDQNRTPDKFALKVHSLVAERIDPKPVGRVKVSFENEPGPLVCRVSVRRSPAITHLDKCQIFVRDGAATRRLEGPALTNWIQQRLN